MGTIAPKTLFRSSHVIRKDKGQEKAFASLAANARIASVINLHDANSKLPSKLFSIPWYKKLVDNKHVIALDMSFDFTTDDFKEKLKKALEFIIHTENP